MPDLGRRGPMPGSPIQLLPAGGGCDDCGCDDCGCAVAPRMADDSEWLRAARYARWLAWASLAWMTAEGVLGLIAGYGARLDRPGRLGAGKCHRGASQRHCRLAVHRIADTVRDRRTPSTESSSRQLLATGPVRRLPGVLGPRRPPPRQPDNPRHRADHQSCVIIMPALGIIKRRLGTRLSSGATAGEETQNLMCAAQAARRPHRPGPRRHLARLLAGRSRHRPGHRRMVDLGRHPIVARGRMLLRGCSARADITIHVCMDTIYRTWVYGYQLLL